MGMIDIDSLQGNQNATFCFHFHAIYWFVMEFHTNTKLKDQDGKLSIKNRIVDTHHDRLNLSCVLLLGHS